MGSVVGLASARDRPIMETMSDDTSCACCSSETPTATPERARWLRIALWLVGGTLAYNVVEAVIALWSGAVADSVALIGFGLDSGIETAAGAVLLWRLAVEAGGAGQEEVERRELAVHRFVGATLLALALYVVGEAAWTLWHRDAPAESLVGIFLAAASLLIMPVMAVAKLRAAREIRSGALRAEAKETIACSYLSGALLVGLGANALWGWWWADPIAALLMVPWHVKEGLEGVRGECNDDDDCHGDDRHDDGCCGDG